MLPKGTRRAYPKLLQLRCEMEIVDQSQNARKWRMVMEFETFNRCYSEQVGWMFCKALVESYVLPYYQDFCHFDYSF